MGPTCVGKSMLARQLSQESRSYCYSVDDLKMFLEMIVTDKIDKALASALNYSTLFGKKSTEALMRENIAVRKLFSYALESVIAHNLHRKTKLILEGSYILPYLGAKKTIMNQSIKSKNIKSIFIVENDEEFIMQNIINRDEQRRSVNGFLYKNKIEQESMYNFIMAEKKYLLEEANKYNPIIIESRPFDTLASRAKKSIDFD